jgi:hypothetical protein
VEAKPSTRAGLRGRGRTLSLRTGIAVTAELTVEGGEGPEVEAVESGAEVRLMLIMSEGEATVDDGTDETKDCAGVEGLSELETEIEGVAVDGDADEEEEEDEE